MQNNTHFIDECSFGLLGVGGVGVPVTGMLAGMNLSKPGMNLLKPEMNLSKPEKNMTIML